MFRRRIGLILLYPAHRRVGNRRIRLIYLKYYAAGEVVLHIEPKIDYVAILDDIFFSFNA